MLTLFLKVILSEFQAGRQYSHYRDRHHYYRCHRHFLKNKDIQLPKTSIKVRSSCKNYNIFLYIKCIDRESFIFYNLTQWWGETSFPIKTFIQEHWFENFWSVYPQDHWLCCSRTTAEGEPRATTAVNDFFAVE